MFCTKSEIRLNKDFFFNTSLKNFIQYVRKSIIIIHRISGSRNSSLLVDTMKSILYYFVVCIVFRENNIVRKTRFIPKYGMRRGEKPEVNKISHFRSYT